MLSQHCKLTQTFGRSSRSSTRRVGRLVPHPFRTSARASGPASSSDGDGWHDLKDVDAGSHGALPSTSPREGHGAGVAGRQEHLQGKDISGRQARPPEPSALHQQHQQEKQPAGEAAPAENLPEQQREAPDAEAPQGSAEGQSLLAATAAAAAAMVESPADLAAAAALGAATAPALLSAAADVAAAAAAAAAAADATAAPVTSEPDFAKLAATGTLGAKGPRTEKAPPPPSGLVFPKDHPFYGTGPAFDHFSNDAEVTDTVRFLIPVATPTTPITDVLQCPQLTDVLPPFDSPFVSHNNWNGGFVHPDDRIALNTIYLASPESASVDEDIESSDETYQSQAKLAIRVVDGLPVIPATEAINHPPATTQQPESQGFGDDHAPIIPLPPWAIRAGARRTIYHNPKTCIAAIVTCGGLCPGVNNVVQGLVHRLSDYTVPDGNIYGIRNGFSGFYNHQSKPVVLTPEAVEGIHLKGGTVLGTSKTAADLKAVVERIKLWGISMLFVIGGDGANRAAQEIHYRCVSEKVQCCVVGVPKSIENNFLLVDRTFGFETAVEEAQRALEAAKVQASSSSRGVSIVKLLGRKSGFVAMQASLASGVVDVCLIPEVKFQLEGPHGLLAFLDKVIERQGHAVVCVSEGAGQDILRHHHHHHQRSLAAATAAAQAVTTIAAASPAPEPPLNARPRAAEQQPGAGLWLGADPGGGGRPALGGADSSAQERADQGNEHEARKHAHHRAVAAAAAAAAGLHLDPSGNPVLRDIGMLLRSRVASHLGHSADVTLIDTIPMLRTSLCHSQDHIYCRVLAQSAVDAAFAGYSGVIVAQVNTHYVLLPIPVITQAPRRVNPSGQAWRRVMSALHQPSLHNHDLEEEWRS